MKLEGKVAIVTGAGRGIGRATVRALACEGSGVVLAARTGAEIDALAGEIGSSGREALPVRTDVTSKSDVESADERWAEVEAALARSEPAFPDWSQATAWIRDRT